MGQLQFYVCVMTNAFAMTSGKDSTPYSLFYSERVSEFGKLLVSECKFLFPFDSGKCVLLRQRQPLAARKICIVNNGVRKKGFV